MSSNEPDPHALDPRSREALLYAEADKLASAGRFAEAIVLLETLAGSAVAIDVLLGTLYTVSGRLEDATATLESALRRGARRAEVAPVLGEVYLMKGDLGGAIEMLRSIPAEALEPSTRGNLALALLRAGDARAAVEVLETTSEPPSAPELTALLGEALCALEAWERAAIVLERLLVARKIDLDSMVNLARAWAHLGRDEEADQAAALVLGQQQLTPQAASAAACVRGQLARARGDAAATERFFTYAAQLAPNDPIHVTNLASLSIERAPGESERLLGPALASDPDAGVTWLWLGRALVNQGRIEEACAAFERAATVRKPAAEADAHLAHAARHLPAEASSRARAGHATPSVAPALDTRPRDEERLRHGRLRLGFVRDELRDGAHEAPLAAALALLCRDHDVFVYGRKAGSPLALRLAERAAWREPRSDADLVALARADELDAAFDLTDGRTWRSAFAARLAPLQVAWAGADGTTGLATMDLFLSDEVHVPSGTEGDFVERVVRLPHADLACEAREAPEGFVPSATLPIERLGAPTLGSLHAPEQLCPRTLDAFAAALAALPDAHLLLQASAFDCGQTRERVIDALRARGIARERLVFFGHASAHARAQALDLVDVALDGWTVSDRTATLDALAMGVPVVAARGASAAGRHAAALLTAAGHADWVADDATTYVAKVVALVNDKPLREALRKDPAGAWRTSPLGDVGALVGALVAAVREATLRA